MTEYRIAYNQIQYADIDKEIDEIIEKYCSKNDKFVKFIYYGYADEIIVPTTEDSNFVLIDKSQKVPWTCTNDFNNVIDFLNLTKDEIQSLVNEIKTLQEKEKSLNEWFIINHICKYGSLLRKLLVLKNIIEASNKYH